MSRSSRPRLRMAVLAFVTLLAPFVLPVVAGAAPSAGQRLPRGCEELQPLLRQVDLPDTALLATVPEPEGAGAAACVYLDQQTGQPNAWLLGVTTVEQYRALKPRMADHIAGLGIDPCTLTFWSSVSAGVQRGLNSADAHDAGRECPPVVEAHGPRAEDAAGAVSSALADAIVAADMRLGWRLTWPLHVQIWDDDTGIRQRGRLTSTATRDAAGEAGVAIVGTHSRTRIVLDLSKIDSEAELRAVVAHEYAHIAQHGITGCTCNLPFWAVEGGAEHFASLVVGPRSPALADRFQEARERVRAGRVRALATLSDRRTADEFQAYSRGYAALLFLSDRWGEETALALYRDNFDGSADGYISHLERRTGLNLESFDTALTEWIAGQRGFAPVPAPETTLAPESRLFALSAGTLIGNAFTVRTAFGPGDRAADVRARWDCLDTDAEVAWTVFDPAGAVAARYRGTARAGCVGGSFISIDLDARLGGSTPRTRPGVWRAEVSLHGIPQGAVTFTIER